MHSRILKRMSSDIVMIVQEGMKRETSSYFCRLCETERCWTEVSTKLIHHGRYHMHPFILLITKRFTHPQILRQSIVPTQYSHVEVCCFMTLNISIATSHQTIHQQRPYNTTNTQSIQPLPHVLTTGSQWCIVSTFHLHHHFDHYR